MKKKIYRALSALCAVMLVLPTMAMTAFAAGETTVYTGVSLGTASVTADNSKPEIFLAQHTTATSDPMAIPTLTGFDVVNDYIELGASVSTTASDDGLDTILSIGSNGAFVIKGISKGVLDTRVRPACNAAYTSYTVTANGTPMNLTEGGTGSINATAVPVLSGAEANVVHYNPATHDKIAPSVTWSLVGNVPEGISINGTGKISIGGNTPVGSYSFTAVATANVAPAISGTSGNITVTVAAKATTCTAVHSGYTVTANNNNFTIADNVGATINLGYQATFKEAETDFTHTDSATHDKNVTPTWSLEGTVPGGVTFDAANGVVSIPNKGLAVGSYSFTARATGDTADKTGTLEIKFTIKSNETCDKVFTGVTLKLDKNALTLPGNAGGELGYTITPNYTGNCTTPAHDHSAYTVTWSFSPAKGVSIDEARQKIKVDGTVPTGTTVSVTATATATAKTRTATPPSTQTFSITRDIACGKLVSNVDMTPKITGLDLGNNPSKVQKFEASISLEGTSCSNPTHNNDPQHGYTPVWSVTKQNSLELPAGIVIDQAGQLTVTAAQIATSQIVTVKVTAGEKNFSQDITVKKTPYNCTKKIDNLTNFGAVTPGAKSPSTAQLVEERSRTVFALPFDSATTATATLQFGMGANKPVFSGECEYEKNNVAAQCPNIKNHKITWKLDKTYSGMVIAEDTGILTVTRDSLANVETAVKVIATVEGVSPVTPLVREGWIVVRKGRYSSSSSSDSGKDSEDREAERIEAIYDKLEGKIEDADRKDTIKADLSSAPNFPARILRDFKGKDVKLELYMGGGFTWKINGKDLKTIPGYQIYLPLGVKRITDGDISDKAKDHDIKIFELEQDGSLYGTYNLQIDLDSDYAKKTVYLYKHLDSSSKLSYKGAAKADSDGYVTFPFTSASTYVITDRPLYGETANTVPSGGGTTGGGTGNTGGGTTATVTPAPPPASVAPSTSSSTTSSSSETSSESEIISESSEEPSKPAEAEPEEKPEPEKKKSKIPIIVPILIVVVTITVVAVVLLAKGGGMNVG